MAKYHGRKGVIYMSATAGGAAVNVGSLSSWELNMKTDKVDVTAFGDTNKTYVQGLADLTGSFSGFFNDGVENVFDAADSADGAKLYLYPASNAAGIFWSGTAWIDASISVPVAGAVAISADFVAAGAWTRTWP